MVAANGKVMRRFSDHESAMFSCVRRIRETDEFPRPPITPLYFHADMTFDPEQENLQFSSTPDGAEI